MISESLYKVISVQWDKQKKIYAKFENIKDRLRLLDEYIGMFGGKNVIEIGCNAGIAAYSIAEVAESYLGIEPEPHYVDQAEIVKKCIKNKNVKFFNGKIMDLVDGNFNALFASYSLYHLSDTEVEYLVSYILPKCDTVIVMNRAKKRVIDKNKYQLWYYKNMIHLLSDCGFNTSFKWGNKKKSFYIITAVKNNGL